MHAGRPDPVPPPPQLYSELRGENERLREALTETTLRLAQLKVELERATQVRPQAGELVRAGPGVPGQGSKSNGWGAGPVPARLGPSGVRLKGEGRPGEQEQLEKGGGLRAWAGTLGGRAE